MESTEEEDVTPDSELSEKDWDHLLSKATAPGRARLDLVAASRPPGEFLQWAGKWSGLIGAIFFLLGILFFFASNWKEMPPDLRLGILQGAVALTTASACVFGPRQTIGRWLLIAATVLVGVLLAVFGQTYQTGADSFEVFALWAALTIVWVAIAKSAGLWLLWYAIAQAALSLYSGQVLVPDGFLSWSGAFVLHSLFSLIGLAVWESLSPRKSFRWLAGDGIRILLVTTAAVWLSFCPWRWIFDLFSSRDMDAETLIGSLLWLMAMGGGVYFYHKVRYSIGAMSVCLFSIGIISVCMVARLLIETDDDSAGIYLFIGLVSVAIFTLIATWIIRVSRAHSSSSSPTPEP